MTLYLPSTNKRNKNGIDNVKTGCQSIILGLFVKTKIYYSNIKTQPTNLWLEVILTRLNVQENFQSNENAEAKSGMGKLHS